MYILSLVEGPCSEQQFTPILDELQACNRNADELANYILGQIIARGLKRGRDRLILPSPICDGDSITQNDGFDEEKTGFHHWDNHSPGTETHGQSKVR